MVKIANTTVLRSAIVEADTSWSFNLVIHSRKCSGAMSPIRIAPNSGRYRHLGEGVHPSLGSLSGYVKLDIQYGGVRRWDPTGARSNCDHTTTALGCSALWALDALEELRSGQPNVQQLREIGDAASLPYTLRWSDQKPHLQRPDADER